MSPSKSINVELFHGETVSHLIESVFFCAKWQTLFDSCVWATSMQGVHFVKPWYKIYKDVYEPLIIKGFDEEKNLVGLLCLAIDRATKEIVIAGAQQCEYQTWLAANEYGDLFIERAMRILSEIYPTKSLSFVALAQGSPLSWASKDKNWGKQTHLRDIALPLLRIGDGSYVEQSLQTPRNRSGISQMKRYGNIEFVQLHKAEELEAVFDEIKLYGDLRLSAFHRVHPSSDPLKKSFYLQLMKAELLHVTLLKIDGRIASAHVNLHNRNQILMGMVTLSPFFAKFSPGKFHIFFLCQELLKQGILTLDLTPGGHYKDRFTNDIENGHALTVFFNRPNYFRFKTKRRIIESTKTILEKINIDHKALNLIRTSFSDKAKFFTLGKATKALFSRIKRKLHDKREMRIYIYNVHKIPPLPGQNLMNRNSLEDLIKYEQFESYQPTISQFHHEALKRIEKGRIIYTRVENDVLVHYGWLVEREEKSFVSEVEQELTLLSNSAVLYDFYSHPSARGKGLFQASLSQMLRDAVEIPYTAQIYISVLADNKPSRHVIEKVGFDYHLSLWLNKTLGMLRSYKSEQADK